MSRLLISVALCTHNGARFLPEQLESIAAQTRLPDELVVCDDRSADRTAEIIRAFAGDVPFTVRWEVNKEKLGSTKNFEKAIDLCEGEIIALADQDDVWKPQKLAVLEKNLKEHPEAGYVFSDAELIDERGTATRTTLWELIRFQGAVLTDFSQTRQVAALLRRGAATGATMAFRSSLKKLLLPISSYFVHDYWISLLASSVASYGVPVPQPLMLYRQHHGQQMGARPRSILEKVRWARQMGRTEHSNSAQGYLDMRERLLALAAQGRAYPADHMVLLQEQIMHSSHRAVAHSKRGAARLGKVFSEVLTGRYARFSNSWVSVVEDLCF
jgi:glycosyltransferase involved in cell wall biosynthesis